MSPIDRTGIAEIADDGLIIEGPALDTFLNRLLDILDGIVCKQQQDVDESSGSFPASMPVFQFPSHEVKGLPPGLALEGPGIVQRSGFGLQKPDIMPKIQDKLIPVITTRVGGNPFIPTVQLDPIHKNLDLAGLIGVFQRS
jgi:hypothetical protein